MTRKRIVITGVGLTAPNGNNLAEFRAALLSGKSGVRAFTTRHLGQVCAGVCDFETTRYQTRKDVKRGTRAGSISIYCAHEALRDAGIDLAAASPAYDRARVGVYVGTTEHGNVETEHEITAIREAGDDTAFWSHHHNPRTVANNPAGEVTLNLKITGPHYCIGAACAAGNLGMVQGYQMLQLDEIDLALCGGVSESIHTFGIFVSFKNQVALGHHPDPAKTSRPFDTARNGIVVSEGGCLYALETLERARARGAKIYGEIVGYGVNSDAVDFVLPFAERQAQCMRMSLAKAGIAAADVTIVNTHATSTPAGDVEEMKAVREVFGEAPATYVNNTKGFIGHCMGAAGSLELAGNLPAFEDGIVHPCHNVENLDPACAMPRLVTGAPVKLPRVDYILNNSFGMLGLNSSVIVRRFER